MNNLLKQRLWQISFQYDFDKLFIESLNRRLLLKSWDRMNEWMNEWRNEWQNDNQSAKDSPTRRRGEPKNKCVYK